MPATDLAGREGFTLDALRHVLVYGDQHLLAWPSAKHVLVPMSGVGSFLGRKQEIAGWPASGHFELRRWQVPLLTSGLIVGGSSCRPSWASNVSTCIG